MILMPKDYDIWENKISSTLAWLKELLGSQFEG